MGVALLRGRAIVLHNARWLALEGRATGGWRCAGRAYRGLRALATGEAGALAVSGAGSRELQAVACQGRRRVIQVRLERLGRRGEPLVLALARDVTTAIRTERRQEGTRAAAAERARLRAVRELTSAVAHEMNNALCAMGLCLAAAQAQLGSCPGGESLQVLTRVMAEAAARVSRLEDAAGLSMAGRADAGRAFPRPARGRPALHVLVVDDDPDVLEAAGLALEHLESRAELALSGAAALARFAGGERFDLVLCDIGMPEVDGWQVAREVGALAPGTPLFLMSGWARELGPEAAQRPGVRGVLSKPLSLDTLRALLADPGAGVASAPEPGRLQAPGPAPLADG